jgi:molybdenum cofactor cytidylyltransferase
MGAFKPLLPFGDKTVIESCIDYLRQSQIQDLIIVVGYRAAEIREKLKTETLAFNPDPNSEMGSSIAIGIRALSETTRAVVIALVDHPAVPASIVSTLIDESKSCDAKIVIPTWQDRGGHPVLVDLTYREELENLAHPTSGGLRELFQTHASGVKRLPVASPFVARDMDTWDDYVALYEEAFGYPPPPR